MSATSPNFHSFTDELMNIKGTEALIKDAAADDKPLPMDTGRKVESAKGHSPLRLAGTLLAGGAAYGLGHGAARLMAMGVNKMLPGIANPLAVDILSKGTGVLAAAGTIAFADAMAENIRMLREAADRRQEREQAERNK